MEPVPDTLRIELPELPCRIGVLEGENETPQPVGATVTIECDLGPVLASGALADTIDYGPLHATLVELIRERTWTLLEGLGGALMEAALRPRGVRAATVEVTKVRPPLGADSGPVTLSFRRERP